MKAWSAWHEEMVLSKNNHRRWLLTHLTLGLYCTQQNNHQTYWPGVSFNERPYSLKKPCQRTKILTSGYGQSKFNEISVPQVYKPSWEKLIHIYVSFKTYIFYYMYKTITNVTIFHGFYKNTRIEIFMKIVFFSRQIR